MDKNNETIPIDLQELREVTRQGAARLRAQVPEIIRFWRNVVTVAARRAWATYGYKSFLLYCAGDLKLKSKTYINDCMHIARLDPLRFDGCILNMDALICAARHLGETAQRALAEAARDPIRSGTFITSAVEKVYKLDDAAAAMYLRLWLIDGQDMKFSEDDEPSGAPPPPQSSTSVCRSLCAALQEVHRLLLLLDKLLTEGDEPSPRAIFELLAQLKDQPRVADLLLEMLQTLPPPKPAPPKKGERRQRGRTSEAKTTPETKVDAAAGAAVGDAQAGGTVVVEQTTAQTTVVDPVVETVVAQTSKVDPVIAPVAAPPVVVEPVVAPPPVVVEPVVAPPPVAVDPVIAPAAAPPPVVVPVVAPPPVVVEPVVAQAPVAEPVVAQTSMVDPVTAPVAAPPLVAEPVVAPPLVVVDPVAAQTSMVDPVIAPVAAPLPVVEPVMAPPPPVVVVPVPAEASPPVAEPAVAQTPVVEPAAAPSLAVEPAVAQTPVAEPVAEPTIAEPATPEPAVSEPAAAPPAVESPPPPALPPSARRPEGWGRDEIHFPVPYPFNVRDLTPLDIIAAGIITLATVASKAAQAAREARRRGIDRAEDVHILLAAYVVRAFGQLKAQGGELRQHLSDFANDGRAKLEPLYRALAASLAAPVGPKPPHAAGALLYQRALAGHDPGAPVPKPTHDPEGWAPVWPVQPLPHWELDADTRAPLPPGVPALTWVKAQCGERLRITEPTEADAPLWRFLGLADALSTEIKRYYATLETLDEPSLDDLLACQLSEALSDVNYQGLLLYRTLEELAQEGEKQEAVITAVAAARQSDADHNLIVLGEARRPKLYFKIGADSRGRIIALSAQTPQHIPVIGCTGCGKTHFTRVAAEACCLDLPGLSTLSEQVRVILMEMDFNKGFTRRQMLAGYQPNTDAAELEYLYRMYGYRARGNEAYTRGKLLVLPDSVERLKIELAPLVERGLQIHPCVVHPSEVGMVGYRAMLANLRHVGGSRRAGYMRTIEAVISSLGDEATPENLIEKIPTLKLHGREQEGMLWQLTELQRLLSQDGSRLIDHLNDPSPVFVLLESRHRSPDVLIPYQMVVLGALSGPLRDGSNPLRVVQIDEGNKISENEVAVEVMTEGGRERRHNPRTLILNGQSILGMDADFFSQATVVLVFRLNSMKDVRALKERFAPFMDVPDEDFLHLADGECLIGATCSTSGERVFRVRIRPTVTNAGGETLQAE